jgi:hypothetical protein
MLQHFKCENSGFYLPVPSDNMVSLLIPLNFQHFKYWNCFTGFEIPPYTSKKSVASTKEIDSLLIYSALCHQKGVLLLLSILFDDLIINYKEKYIH